MNKSLLLGLATFAIVGVVMSAYLAATRDARTPVTSETVPVLLYYYDPAKDWDETMGAKCDRNSVTAIGRYIPASETVILDTLRLLLTGDLKPEEKQAGLATEFPLLGVTLDSAQLQDGTLTLTFTDPEGKTGGGSCRVAVLWGQIERTARQFPGVERVVFQPEELFQP